MGRKTDIQEAVKMAMRARDRVRLATLRLITAEIKQIEVDQRKILEDADVLQVLERMLKQRKDSIEQFTRGDRPDLALIEEAEVAIIQEFMPEPLSPEELSGLIARVLSDSGASGMQDMGRVMKSLREQVLGRADMSEVSRQVRAALAE